MTEKRTTVRVRRHDPQRGGEPHDETYENVPWEGRRVLDVLNYIQQELDTSLAYRYSCRAGLCGACIVRVNGRSVMSCKHMAEEDMTIEPPKHHPVIKDLVVDFRKKTQGVPD